MLEIKEMYSTSTRKPPLPPIPSNGVQDYLITLEQCTIERAKYYKFRRISC